MPDSPFSFLQKATDWPQWIVRTLRDRGRPIPRFVWQAGARAGKCDPKGAGNFYFQTVLKQVQGRCRGVSPILSMFAIGAFELQRQFDRRFDMIYRSLGKKRI